ncbi:hypothetical protein GCM10009730_31760 [Streptomyces albidochromogenes]|uniref:hypothetical protein n=1 Tax=Streptomyces albidochromogenes TaxID=329524 RepID=UPI00110F8B8F|nr:hypothetical protein [Streptomyces albidochromogenes]
MTSDGVTRTPEPEPAVDPAPDPGAVAPEGAGGEEPGEQSLPPGDPAYPSPDAPAPVPVPIDDPAAREGDGGMPPDTLPPPLGG